MLFSLCGLSRPDLIASADWSLFNDNGLDQFRIHHRDISSHLAAAAQLGAPQGRLLLCGGNIVIKAAADAYLFFSSPGINLDIITVLR